MMAWRTIPALTVLVASLLQAAPRPCATTEARQFDFWIGSWDLEWTTNDGKTMTGTNTVSALYDSCVLREQFQSDSTNFAGMSVSTFDAQAKQWKQTWVDNSSSYLDFAGQCENGTMVLSRKAERNGKKFLQRMRWYDISKDSFLWNWERSDDDGATWTVLWKIAYSRR